MTMHKRTASKPGSGGMAGAVMTPPTNTVDMIKAIREGHKVKSDIRIDEFMKGTSALETSVNADTRANSTIGATNLD